MTVPEKAGLILFGVVMSVIINFMFRYLDRCELKTALSRELSFLVENLEVAIINNNATECRPSIENLTRNYTVFCKDEAMTDGFRKIHSIYTFLSNGGYEKDPSRKENDLQTVRHIRGRLR